MKSISKVFLLILLSVLLFATCDNPIGLGTKVNTEKPVIKTSGKDNKPGSFFQGSGDNESNRIWLDIEQEFGISEVFMDVDYVDSVTGETKTKTIKATMDPVTKKWYVDLDTTGMADGQIKTRVTAIDVDGNKATTTDIVYFVKNSLPQIKLNMPGVSENQFDDDAFLNNLINTDPLYMGFELLGLATDNYGIAAGYPKIMIWPVDSKNIPENIKIEYKEEDGTTPKESNDHPYGTWHQLIVPNDKRTDEEDSPVITATKFSWPMFKLHKDTTVPGGWRLPKGNETPENLGVGKYRIKIVTKDLFGNENTYPNRDDHGDSKASKNYIEINYLASDIPVIQVTDSPQYYNGAKNLEVDFLISSQNPLHLTEPVEAYVAIRTSVAEDIMIGGPYTPVFQPPNRGSPYGYKLTITPEQVKNWVNPIEGTMSVRLRAKDDQDKNGPYLYQTFTYDTKPPEVIIDRPVNLLTPKITGKLTGGAYSIYYPADNPKWVTGTITVGGTPSDDSNIKGIYYHVGKLGDDFNSQDFWNAHYDDDAIWQDTKLNTPNPVSPWGGTFNVWTYTVIYPLGYKLNNLNLVQDLIELNDYPNNTTTITDGLQGDGTPRERFYLPFYVKVVDGADNFHIVHYKLSVDPKLDEPQISIQYPPERDNKGEITKVGGTVRVTGSAEDNYWMHTVLMRVHKYGDGNNNPVNPAYWYVPTTAPDPDDPNKPLKLFYPNSTFPAPLKIGGGYDEDGWFKVSLVNDGPSVNWTATVNGDRKLDPPDGVETVDVTFEIIAIDTNEPTHQTPHIVGPIAKQTIQFSSKVPRIEDVKIIKNGESKNFVDGTTTSGKFVISMNISALSGINTIFARVNNDSQVTLMISNVAQNVNNAVWNFTTPIMNSDLRYETTLTMTVDSTAANSIVSGIGYGKTGEMNLEITVEDSTAQNWTTTNNFRVGIDNFYPSATIETSTMAYDKIIDTTDTKNNKYFRVQGTMQDYGPGSGTLQGLERMLVYFEGGRIRYTNTTTWEGRYVEGNQSMFKPDGSTASLLDFVEYPVMDTTKPPLTNPAEPNAKTGFVIPKHTTFTNPNNGKEQWKCEAAMVIDYPEYDPEQDYDGDGTYGEDWRVSERTWEARMLISNPSTKAQQFTDGPYIVHYIIMDHAGNATHYQKDIYIENNKPRITHINIGTDINFDDKVDTWLGSDNPREYRKDAFIIDNTSEGKGTIVVDDEDFRIRNYRFGIRLTWEKGNGEKRAQVTYVTRSGSSIPVADMKRGHVYQIASTAVDTDFTLYGSPNNYTDTVFVAASKGEGKGTVYPFNQFNSTSEQELPLGTAEVSSSISNDYVNFTGIPNNTKGLFIMKVYDTAVAGTTMYPVHPEYDQLAQAVLLTVSVNNEDTIPPKIEVANFGRKYITQPAGNARKYEDNELSVLADAVYTDYIDTTGNTKNGYVQYQAHSPGYNAVSDTGVAYVSGKVIFNGKVNDNHRIKRITAQIPGYNGDAEFSIAERNPSNGLLQGADTNIEGEREFRLVYTQDQVPQYSLEYGHTLVWRFMWDSSKVSNVAENGVTVTFNVYDETQSGPASVKTVNIVPYITEITTPLSGAYASSPSAFNRSALGGYPIKEDDSITIKGFNFGNATNNVTINGASIGTVTNNGTTITGTIPPNAESGPLVVTVNSIVSFNNSSNKNKTGGNWIAPYNQEPNGVNNNTLDNSRYIYVWKTGYLMNRYGAVRNPFFRMGIDGRRYMTFGSFDSRGRWRVLENNTFQGSSNDDGLTPTAGYLEQNGNRFLNLTIAVDQAGSWYAGASNQTNTGTTQLIYYNFFARTVAAGTSSSGAGDNKRRILSMYNGTSVNENRVRFPRVYAYNTNGDTENNNGFKGGDSTGTNDKATRIFMSYYDGNSTDNPVIFRYGTVGANNNFGGDLGYTETAPPAQENAAYSEAQRGRNENDPGTSAYGSCPGTTTANTNLYRQIVANNSTTYKGSEYTAVGGLSNGRPVIAWYDNAGSKLIFSYGDLNNTMSTVYNNANARVTTTTATWQNNAEVVDTNKGTHVDMAVDGADNIHLAYYDPANGGLYYAYIPNNVGTPNTGAIQKVRVDTYLAVGTKIMINVRKEGSNYVPYITYFHGSFTETKNSIRVAWRKDFSGSVPHGTNEDNTFTGKWEVMTVPANGVPVSGEFICNGVPNPTSAVGSWIDPNLTGGYSTPALTRGSVDLRRSIVVGYMTGNYYEGAMLNADMSGGLSAK